MDSSVPLKEEDGFSPSRAQARLNTSTNITSASSSPPPPPSLTKSASSSHHSTHHSNSAEGFLAPLLKVTYGFSPNDASPGFLPRSLPSSSSGSSSSSSSSLLNSWAGDDRSKWAPDSTLDNCPLCSLSFDFITNRKHHCRRCGTLVCDSCSTGRSKQSTRLCDICFACTSGDPTRFIPSSSSSSSSSSTNAFSSSSSSPSLLSTSTTSSTTNASLSLNSNSISSSNIIVGVSTASTTSSPSTTTGTPRAGAVVPLSSQWSFVDVDSPRSALVSAAPENDPNATVTLMISRLVSAIGCSHLPLRLSALSLTRWLLTDDSSRTMLFRVGGLQALLNAFQAASFAVQASRGKLSSPSRSHSRSAQMSSLLLSQATHGLMNLTASVRSTFAGALVAAGGIEALITALASAVDSLNDSYQLNSSSSSSSTKKPDKTLVAHPLQPPASSSSSSTTDPSKPNPAALVRCLLCTLKHSLRSVAASKALLEAGTTSSSPPIAIPILLGLATQPAHSNVIRSVAVAVLANAASHGGPALAAALDPGALEAVLQFGLNRSRDLSTQQDALRLLAKLVAPISSSHAASILRAGALKAILRLAVATAVTVSGSEQRADESSLWLQAAARYSAEILAKATASPTLVPALIALNSSSSETGVEPVASTRRAFVALLRSTQPTTISLTLAAIASLARSAPGLALISNNPSPKPDYTSLLQDTLTVLELTRVRSVRESAVDVLESISSTPAGCAALASHVAWLLPATLTVLAVPIVSARVKARLCGVVISLVNHSQEVCLLLQSSGTKEAVEAVAVHWETHGVCPYAGKKGESDAPAVAALGDLASLLESAASSSTNGAASSPSSSSS